MQLYDPATSIYQFDGHRADLAQEFKDNRHGPHSEELRRILHRMRTMALEQRYCVVVIEPFRRWALARLSGRRGVPPQIFADRIFTSLAQAEWEIFKLRWRQLSGIALDI